MEQIATLTNIIDAALQDPGREPSLTLTMTLHQDTPDDDTRKFRASDAGRCHVYRFFKRQGADKTAADARSRLIMEHGNLIHAWLETLVTAAGARVCAELYMEDAHRSGHLDLIIADPADGHQILYDLKTIGGKAAYYMQRNGWQAKPQHIMQVLTYQHMWQASADLGHFGDADLRDCRIAYVERDTLAIHEVEVRLDSQPLVRDCRLDWEILIDAWESGSSPRPTDQTWECRYCPYASQCDYFAGND